MRISSLRYQPIEGGTLAGLFAIHVRLGADSSPESFSFDDTQLSRKIHEAFEALTLSSNIEKGVLLDCRDAETIDTAEMSSFISTLNDWGYFVGAWVNDGKRSAWFSLLRHIVVFIDKPFWSNFKVNEIRYTPSGPDYIEPEVYDVNKGAFCYIQAQDNPRIVTFITGAKRTWGIVVPLRSYPQVNFSLSE